MSRQRSALLACSLSFVMLACTACGQAPPGTNGSPTTASSDKYAFTVAVTLSDAARKQFDKSGESLVIGAAYFATPAANAPKGVVNEIGTIDLGRKEKELASSGEVTFDGSALKRDRLTYVKGLPQVNINVWSGRKSSPDNLLDCDMFQDAITVAARKNPITLHCRLIDEPDSEKSDPAA